MNIHKTSLPNNSCLNPDIAKYDYVDSFRGLLNDIENKYTSADIGKAFFSSGPKWVEKLFRWRNKIVAIVGLKTSGDTSNSQKQLENFRCEPGEQLGLFRVFYKSEHEVILGEDDKHLNFRISLYLNPALETSKNKTLTISTTVEFNNWFGRFYFLFVRPFHKLIVPRILKGIIKELEARNIPPN